MWVLVFRRMRRCVHHNLPDDLLGFGRRVARRRQRNIVRQPDVDIEPELNILREELLLEMGGKKSADRKKYQRAEKDAPAVSDAAADKSVAEAIEAPLALFL